MSKKVCVGYHITTLPEEDILSNHCFVLCSYGMLTKDEELVIPSFY